MEYLWVVLGLLSALFAALVAIFGKIGLQGIDSNTATAIRAVIMALFLVAVIWISGKLPAVWPLLRNNKAMMYIVFSGVAGALSWLFYFMALKIAPASKVAPIDRLSVVFVIILAALFLGEKLTLKVGIGAALVAVGAILIALG